MDLTLYSFMQIMTAAFCAFLAHKRGKSAIFWGILGYFFPIIAIPLAFFILYYSDNKSKQNAEQETSSTPTNPKFSTTEKNIKAINPTQSTPIKKIEPKRVKEKNIYIKENAILQPALDVKNTDRLVLEAKDWLNVRKPATTTPTNSADRILTMANARDAQKKQKIALLVKGIAMHKLLKKRTEEKPYKKTINRSYDVQFTDVEGCHLYADSRQDSTFGRFHSVKFSRRCSHCEWQSNKLTFTFIFSEQGNEKNDTFLCPSCGKLQHIHIQAAIQKIES